MLLKRQRAEKKSSGEADPTESPQHMHQPTKWQCLTDLSLNPSSKVVAEPKPNVPCTSRNDRQSQAEMIKPKSTIKLPKNQANPATSKKAIISRRTMLIPIPQQIRMAGIVKQVVARAVKLSPPGAAQANPTPKIQASGPLGQSKARSLQQMNH